MICVSQEWVIVPPPKAGQTNISIAPYLWFCAATPQLWIQIVLLLNVERNKHSFRAEEAKERWIRLSWINCQSGLSCYRAVSISACQQISLWLAVTVLNLELNPTKPLVLKLWGNAYVKRWKCNMFERLAEKWQRNRCLRFCLTICCFPKVFSFYFTLIGRGIWNSDFRSLFELSGLKQFQCDFVLIHQHFFKMFIIIPGQTI